MVIIDYFTISIDTIERTIIDEKKKEKADQPTKRVSKKHFANEETKQKALEWADSSSTNVSCDLEELDPPPFDKPSYKSSYKQAIQSVTEDFRNSLVESIAEAKQKVIIVIITKCGIFVVGDRISQRKR